MRYRSVIIDIPGNLEEAYTKHILRTKHIKVEQYCEVKRIRGLQRLIGDNAELKREFRDYCGAEFVLLRYRGGRIWAYGRILQAVPTLYSEDILDKMIYSYKCEYIAFIMDGVEVERSWEYVYFDPETRKVEKWDA